MMLAARGGRQFGDDESGARLRRARSSSPGPAQTRNDERIEALREAALDQPELRGRGQLADSRTGGLPRPNGRKPSGRGAARPGQHAAPACGQSSPQHAADARDRNTRPDRPPCLAFSRRAKITDQGRTSAALRALHLDCDLPRQDLAPIRRTGKTRRTASLGLP
jgi:hypothetical protein